MLSTNSSRLTGFSKNRKFSDRGSFWNFKKLVKEGDRKITGGKFSGNCCTKSQNQLSFWLKSTIRISKAVLFINSKASWGELLVWTRNPSLSKILDKATPKPQSSFNIKTLLQLFIFFACNYVKRKVYASWVFGGIF